MRDLPRKFLIVATIMVCCIPVWSWADKPSPTLKGRGSQAYSPSLSSRKIRILTLNVWSGLTYKGCFRIEPHPDNSKKRYALLVKEVRKLAPDTIAIQEANPLPQYAKRLAEDLDYRMICGVAIGGIRLGSFGIPTNLREGQAILVKKPWTLEKIGKKRLGGLGIATNWFCFSFEEITQALLGQAMVNGKPLYVYTVHLHSSLFRGPSLDVALQRLAGEMPNEKLEEVVKGVEQDVKRRKQEIVNLMGFIEKTLPFGMPAIILGDFNTTVESGELASLLEGEKWVDSFKLKNPHEEGMTWDPGHNPNFRQIETGPNPHGILRANHERHPYRIDFILINRAIPQDQVLESRVVLTPVEGVSVSDHYGVMTTLRW